MAATVEVRERPILMTGYMVRAVLEDRKTMTRRIMKPQPEHFDEQPYWRWKPKRGIGAAFGPFAVASGDKPGMFGPWEVGMRLWVRETWQPAINGDTGEIITIYKADWELNGGLEGPVGGKWRPSIHMPRSACRLILELTDVRVERLQEIEAEDVDAEGLPESEWSHVDGYRRDEFAALWDKLNGNGAWERNDWVWVIAFKRVTDA